MINELKQRELKFGEIILLGCSIYKKTFYTILPIILIFYIPTNIILSLIPTNSILDIFVSLLIGFILSIILSIIVERFLFGENLKYDQALKLSYKRWKDGIVTGLLSNTIILGLLILLIIPGIIWAVYYTFGLYVVALRNKSQKEALDYSKHLVKDNWWKVFSFTILFAIIAWIISLVVTYPLRFVKEIYVLDLLSNTVVTVIYIFPIICTVILFLNMEYLKNNKIKTIP